MVLRGRDGGAGESGGEGEGGAGKMRAWGTPVPSVRRRLLALADEGMWNAGAVSRGVCAGVPAAVRGEHTCRAFSIICSAFRTDWLAASIN